MTTACPLLHVVVPEVTLDNGYKQSVQVDWIRSGEGFLLLAQSANSPPFPTSPAYRSETGRPDITMFLNPLGPLTNGLFVGLMARAIKLTCWWGVRKVSL